MSDYRRPATLYMTLGISGSGKSTWAKQAMAEHPPGSFVRVNKDSLRLMAHDGRFAGRQTEAQIVAMRDAIVKEMLRSGVDVIVDDTNLAVVHESRLRELAADLGARFEVVDFSAEPTEVCIARDRQRPKSEQVGADVIRKQARDLAKRGMARQPLASGFYVPAADLPGCVLVDLDGTLAIKGERSPYDWHRVGEDAPNQPVVELVSGLVALGENVIVLSGRDGECRAESQAWLDANVSSGLPLIMRTPGDQRRDDVVKLELFNEYIRDRFNVKYVIDDRQRVVDMWRRVLGLTVMQVAPGDFDVKPLTVEHRKALAMPSGDTSDIALSY